MVVSVNGNQSQIVMLSLPRDTVDVPLGDGQIYHGKINAISRVYDLPTLQAAMSALLDIPIDAYLKIDMDDLVTLVDAVGGVEIDVPTTLHDAHIGLDLPAGPTHFDGALALAYSRSRVDSDYRRAARQQQVVLALVRAFVNPETSWSPVGSARQPHRARDESRLDGAAHLPGDRAPCVGRRGDRRACSSRLASRSSWASSRAPPAAG